jgi:hypothetical protein
MALSEPTWIIVLWLPAFLHSLLKVIWNGTVDSLHLQLNVNEVVADQLYDEVRIEEITFLAYGNIDEMCFSEYQIEVNDDVIHVFVIF